ncbi:MAG: hypothetical protein R2867_16850 [Caldilineaceae bacterium]
MARFNGRLVPTACAAEARRRRRWQRYQLVDSGDRRHRTHRCYRYGNPSPRRHTNAHQNPRARG